MLTEMTWKLADAFAKQDTGLAGQLASLKSDTEKMKRAERLLAQARGKQHRAKAREDLVRCWRCVGVMEQAVMFNLRKHVAPGR